VKTQIFIKHFITAFFFVQITSLNFLFAQNVYDYTVQVTAVASISPLEITLSWPSDANATSYIVYRKSQTASSWGTAISTLSASATGYTDNTVTLGTAYEYRILKVTPSYNGYGYVFAACLAPFTRIESFGTVILVVEDSVAINLSTELNQMKEDLWGDGYSVISLQVSRNDSVNGVKSLIQTITDTNATVSTIYLLGRVPVPYSGDFNPDAHPDHQGAWPADVFYADIDGNWYDLYVNNASASRVENQNIPNDGKFDQSSLPSNVDLRIGRVDLYDMGSFGTEMDLLQQYLNRDHAYRQGVFKAGRKALVDDNFGVFSGEVFAANGWRNFAPAVSPDSNTADDYRTLLNADSYLWSYGCGGGWYQGAGGIANSSDFVSDSLQGVFTMLFGSYFGDWDNQDNFLRAPLAAKGTILTNAWAGRPHWHFHHMGLGEPIGYSAKLSQNNSNLYFANYSARYVHIALMGDPTLRQDITNPPKNLTVNSVSVLGSLLEWNSSSDSVSGYVVYRTNDLYAAWERITPQPITDTLFIDSCPYSSDSWYMIRAVQPISWFSGSYENLSQGVIESYSNTTTLTSSYTPPATICDGSTIQVPYTFGGSWCTASIMTLECSDAFGSFSNPIQLGSQTTQSSSTLTGLFPGNLAPGSGYLLRLNNSAPQLFSDTFGPFTLNPLPVPDFSFSVNGWTATFTDNSQYATSWHWDFGTGDTSNLQNPVYTFPGSGPWQVVLTVSNGCGQTQYTQTVSGSVGISEIGLNRTEIYPNPFSNEITVRFPETGNSFWVRLKGLRGELLFEEETENETLVIPAQLVKAGIYFLELESEGTSQVFKLIKTQ